MSSTEKLRTGVLLLLLVLVSSLFLVRTVVPAAGRLTAGYLAAYVGAQVVKEGEPASRLYDSQWFSARVREVSGGKVTDIYTPDPPALAVAWLPFAHLSAERARWLWIWLNVVWLGAALALITASLPWPHRLAALVGLTALFTLAAPTREQFQFGQLYAFLLLLHTIGWRAYARGQYAAAGLALGLAVVLKISGWPIGLLMMVQGRWKAVGWAVATVAVAVVVTLPWVGVGAWQELLSVAIPDALHWPGASLTAYQDTPGFWQHWLRFDARVNPHALMDAPAAAAVLSAATAVIACWLLVVRKRPAYVSFAAAVALVELLSPVAEQYHYTVVLLPLAVLWYQVSVSRNHWAVCCALAATVLIAWPINYKAFHPAWALLLSYPRLFGGWLVFAALLTPWRGLPATELASSAARLPPAAGAS